MDRFITWNCDTFIFGRWIISCIVDLRFSYYNWLIVILKLFLKFFNSITFLLILFFFSHNYVFSVICVSRYHHISYIQAAGMGIRFWIVFLLHIKVKIMKNENSYEWENIENKWKESRLEEKHLKYNQFIFILIFMIHNPLVTSFYKPLKEKYRNNKYNSGLFSSKLVTKHLFELEDCVVSTCRKHNNWASIKEPASYFKFLKLCPANLITILSLVCFKQNNEQSYENNISWNQNCHQNFVNQLIIIVIKLQVLNRFEF